MPVAIRNSLLLVLAGTAGYFDALCYLALTVFPANMTGNTVLLSIALGFRKTRKRSSTRGSPSLASSPGLRSASGSSTRK